MNVRGAEQSAAGTAAAAPGSVPRQMSLRKNFAWTLMGNFFYGGAQWGMLIVIAKLGSPEMVGRFALAFAVTAPVIMFANLNLRGVLATDATLRFRFGDYLALRLAALALALLVIAGITMVSGYAAALALTVLAVALAKTSESLSDVYYGLLQQHERMDRISISISLKGALSLAALGLGVAVTGDILWGSVWLAVVWGLLLLCYDIPTAASCVAKANGGAMAQVLRPHWEWQRLRELAWLALPLGVATLLNSLLTNIPRYFIKGMLGERELGIFAAMAYVIIIGARVVTALGESASPRLARLHAQRDFRGYRALVVKMVGIGAACGGGGLAVTLLAGRPLLTLLYRPEYADNLSAFVWIMVAAGIGYVALFLQYGMTAARSFRAQPIILAVSVATLTCACFLLIPRMGVTGAAISLAVTSLVQLLGNAYVMRRILSELQGSSQC